MSVSDSRFHNEAIIDKNDGKINEIIEFIVEYYSSFMIEDALFQELRESIKKLLAELRNKYLNECKQVRNKRECQKDVEKVLNELLKILYAASNEPVRLGEFRVLFHEVYRRVHGSLSYLSYKSPNGIDLVLHGVMREKLRVFPSEERIHTESYHTGIDYVALIEYPISEGQNVVVPLFVIAKSSPEDVKEIELKKAITEVLQQGVSENIVHALESMPSFTRIVLTRTIYKGEETEALCMADDYQEEIPVYRDIACGIISIVFRDIPGMYEGVTGNERLTKLSMDDWIKALVSLAIPVLRVDVASASNPPKDPGGRGIDIDSIIKRIYQDIHQEALERVGTEVERQLNNVKGYVSRLKPKWEKQLTEVTNRYKDTRRTSAMMVQG